MTIRWPRAVLRPQDPSFDIAPRSLAAPASVSGAGQVVSSDAGIWKATFGGVIIRNRQHVLTFRAIANLLEGRLGTILLPVCRGYQPVPEGSKPLYDQVPHSDDAFFDDDTGYVGRVIDVVTVGSMALRAVSGTVSVNYAGEIEPGQHFSVGERLYRVRSYKETVPATPAGTVTASGDFAGSSYDPARLSLLRASPATYFDASGILRTAANDVLRLDHDPVTGAAEGALMEVEGTNLLLYSRDLANAYWTKSNYTVTPNAAAALDGTMTMAKLVETTAVGVDHAHYVNLTVTPNTLYCASWVLKAGERTKGRIYWALPSNGGGGNAIFDLTAGTITVPTVYGSGSSYKSGIIDLGDDLYLVWISGIADPTATSIRARLSIFNEAGGSAYTGDGASGMYADEVQVEAGVYPTSRIRTAGAAATRAADVLTLMAEHSNDWVITFDDGSTQIFSNVAGDLVLTAAMLGRNRIASYRAALAKPLPATAEITFRPPLREAVPSGTNLEFDDPVCRMRLATDDAMDLPLDLGRFAFPTVNFVEDL